MSTSGRRPGAPDAPAATSTDTSTTQSRRQETTAQLAGKVAVITGGSAGIGLATARRFVAEDARVFLTGRRTEPLAAAVDDLGPAATAVPAVWPSNWETAGFA